MSLNSTTGPLSFEPCTRIIDAVIQPHGYGVSSSQPDEVIEPNRPARSVAYDLGRARTLLMALAVIGLMQAAAILPPLYALSIFAR